MIIGSCSNIRKIVLGLIFLSGSTVSLFLQGATIGGVINRYTYVISIGASDNVTVNNAALFSKGDTVLLIQMKGAMINVPESSAYGSYQTSLGSPGSYEFLIVQSVNNSTGNIVFTSNILNSYDVRGLVQLIRAPYYNSVTVSSELTCQPWDSLTKTGGILTLIVGGTLSLEANINVTGKGFLGGTPYSGQGFCINDNLALYDKYGYANSWANSGFKGESLVTSAYLGPGIEPSIYPDYAKGKGANFTGGGGGNGRFSGGGGGANIGAGGKGGRESNLCAPFQGEGGLGGKQVKFTDLEGSILLGSGGGSSTYLPVGSASPGGRGGGIIIIVCDTLKGKGKIIAAEGIKPASASSGNAGAGGGGSGGSVAIYLRSFSTQPTTSALTISAKGGNGGNANNQFGEGGGGGGGLILTNNISIPGTVTKSFAGGIVGTRTGGSTGGTGGLIGESLTSFTPLLNGFLYNSIRSSVTLNQVDSVCSNMIPPKMTGTKPVGGTGSYTYIWQKSYESTFASPIVLTNDADPINYTPKLSDAITPVDTVWFRRIVISSGPPVITDISKPVKIVVHPSIKNNITGNPDTICINGNPPLIQQLVPDLIVPTSKYLFFSWQDSSSSGTWGLTVGTGKNYDPAPGLTKTTWYRRTVRSGSCLDSSAKVKITVLPAITNNKILNQPDDICYGASFNNLSATTGTTNPPLGGGDNSFRFKWVSNINLTGWGVAPGVINIDSYNPVELPQKVPSNDYLFRRIAYSGIHNVCIDTSITVHLRDFPAITNNIINTVTANLPICSGSAPGKIDGPQPLNGNGVFTYIWQDSSNSVTQWKNITGAINVTNTGYQPPVLGATTSYRRIAYSSACADISNSVKITVHQPISNNNISLLSGGAPDTTICSGQKPHRFTGSVATGGTGLYNYQWLDSTAAKNLTAIPAATQVNFPNTTSLDVTTFYKRQVTSGGCSVKSSSTITVNVLPPITNNIISASQTAVCGGTVPEPVTGESLSGGSGTFLYLWEQSTDGGTNWMPAQGTNTLSIYQPPVLTNAMKYRRKVRSGPSDCCSSTSPDIDISIDPKPESPVYAGKDTTIYSFEKNFRMDAAPPVISGETGLWTVLDPMTGIIADVSDPKTEVSNLSRGKNLFLWTITNGPCNLADSVSIELYGDFIPQGFSPNGDGWNNTFIIEGLNLMDQQIAELTVLNGAGTVVFSTSNRDNREWINWDGKNNKGVDLPEGTYYYILKITTKDNRVIKKSGFIILKRY